MWGVKQRWSEKSLSGARERILLPVPRNFYGQVVFQTRAEARAFIKENFGYIGTRPDLRARPHGMLMPKAVKVEIKISEVTN